MKLGQKMGGQMGNETLSILNQKVMKLIPDQNLVLIEGGIPGAPVAASSSCGSIKKGRRQAEEEVSLEGAPRPLRDKERHSRNRANSPRHRCKLRSGGCAPVRTRFFAPAIENGAMHTLGYVPHGVLRRRSLFVPDNAAGIRAAHSENY